jgi:glycosyltransferase involved in cell wall biosynthesis
MTKNIDIQKKIKNLKVAIVVEELTQLGGAERVLDVMLELYPKAPVYTIVWDKEKTDHVYDKFEVKTSFIQKMPFGIKKYKWYLPLMPFAVESFKLKDYDLVFSITSALAKGIKTKKDQIHICFCNTPTRYLWQDTKSYIKTAPIPAIIKKIMPLVVKLLQKWDLKASRRPDYFIANSYNIQKKIKKYYHRDSVVIHPPIDCKKFSINNNPKKYFLLVSRIEPYKKVDLAIEAFNCLKYPLKIVGSGSKKEILSLKAKSNIEFLGRVSDEELIEIYKNAKAFIFPQDEDFGLTPLEAMASGVPVIAYKKGGALETVIEGKTGEFFYPQTVEALTNTLKRFNKKKYSLTVLRNQAEKFDKSIFKNKILEYINSRLKERKYGA